jgi:hypothetical protein
MAWIDLAEDGENWRTLVKALMNFRVPQIRGPAEELFDFQEGLCSV